MNPRRLSASHSSAREGAGPSRCWESGSASWSRTRDRVERGSAVERWIVPTTPMLMAPVMMILRIARWLLSPQLRGPGWDRAVFPDCWPRASTLGSLGPPWAGRLGSPLALWRALRVHPPRDRIRGEIATTSLITARKQGDVSSRDSVPVETLCISCEFAMYPAKVVPGLEASSRRRGAAPGRRDGRGPRRRGAALADLGGDQIRGRPARWRPGRGSCRASYSPTGWSCPAVRCRAERTARPEECSPEPGARDAAVRTLSAGPPTPRQGRQADSALDPAPASELPAGRGQTLILSAALRCRQH